MGDSAERIAINVNFKNKWRDFIDEEEYLEEDLDVHLNDLD